MKILELLGLPALIVALVAGMGSQQAYAGGQEPHTMPLRGIGTLRVVPAAGTIDCLAPDATVITPFPAELDALARYSGMGRTIGTITADSCAFNPAYGTLEVAGTAYQTAANGDEVYAPYVGVFQPDFSFGLDVEVKGGTGRFANACGAAYAGGSIDLATGAGVTWLDGWISTAGPGGPESPCE